MLHRTLLGKRLPPPSNDRWIVGEIRPLARLAATRSVADLLAVRLHLRRRPLVLARLDVGQDITEPLVLGDRRMRPRWSLSNTR